MVALGLAALDTDSGVAADKDSLGIAVVVAAVVVAGRDWAGIEAVVGAGIEAAVAAAGRDSLGIGAALQVRAGTGRQCS